ncbi:MAG: polynucleotide adenylyltransferase PcnB [Bdellovibrionota bacterium]
MQLPTDEFHSDSEPSLPIGEDGHITPLVIPRAEHPISRKKISPEALRVLYGLYHAGYKAYLVGGSVRDLLLKREPKDFDVVTDAHPREIKAVFRNSRIIGRRFQVAHVHFGKDKIVEVSTFRSLPVADDAIDAEALPPDGAEPQETAEANGQETPAKRRWIDENQFGSEEEDALRRDLTINALFYDIATFSVIDYVGGLSDLHDEIIRIIGDPDVRFTEDPVRIIRAIRHAARTGFKIEPRTLAAIRKHHPLLPTCAPARVLEEFLRELRGGSSYESFRLMVDTSVLKTLFPPIAEYLGPPPVMEPEPGTPWYRLKALDRLRAERGTPPSDSILLAHIAVPILEKDVEEACDPSLTKGQLASRLDQLRLRYEEVCAALGLPRRMCMLAGHHLAGMCRIRRTIDGGSLARGLVGKSYFKDAYALYELDAIARGETPIDPQNLVASAQAHGPAESGGPPPRRRRRRRRKPPTHKEH